MFFLHGFVSWPYISLSIEKLLDITDLTWNVLQLHCFRSNVQFDKRNFVCAFPFVCLSAVKIIGKKCDCQWNFFGVPFVELILPVQQIARIDHIQPYLVPNRRRTQCYLRPLAGEQHVTGTIQMCFFFSTFYVCLFVCLLLLFRLVILLT